jgi:ABC-2 type transport system ATP-binding protein
MQRRLHVAVALVHSPRLVILDEPSTGLDVQARHEQWGLIRRLQAQGTAVLLATHLLDEAEALCDRIGILQAGHILAEGSPEELRGRIPAAEVALVRSEVPEAVIAMAARLGIEVRRLDHDLALWLPKKLELRALLDLLGDTPLTSVARRPVLLSDAYVELTSASGAGTSQ